MALSGTRPWSTRHLLSRAVAPSRLWHPQDAAAGVPDPLLPPHRKPGPGALLSYQTAGHSTDGHGGGALGTNASCSTSSDHPGSRRRRSHRDPSVDGCIDANAPNIDHPDADKIYLGWESDTDWQRHHHDPGAVDPGSPSAWGQDRLLGPRAGHLLRDAYRAVLHCWPAATASVVQLHSRLWPAAPPSARPMLHRGRRPWMRVELRAAFLRACAPTRCVPGLTTFLKELSQERQMTGPDLPVEGLKVCSGT